MVRRRVYRTSRGATLIALLVLLTLTLWPKVQDTFQKESPTPLPLELAKDPAREVQVAKTRLDSLEIKPRCTHSTSPTERRRAPCIVPMYDREPQFGELSDNYGGRKCSTRNVILARDLDSDKFDDRHCKVLSGHLTDPYTGKDIDFVAGPSTSDDVQIDHVVPLALIWDMNDPDFTALDSKEAAKNRLAIAHDPLNLLAVGGAANQDKSDDSLSQWRVPNRAFQCTFTIRYVTVLHAYDLPITKEDASQARRDLNECGSTVYGNYAEVV